MRNGSSVELKESSGIVHTKIASKSKLHWFWHVESMDGENGTRRVIELGDIWWEEIWNDNENTVEGSECSLT